MALSDEEERILAEMAKNLYEQDPKLVRSLNSGREGSFYGATVGVLALLGGMAMIVGGVAANLVPLGIAGFCLALFGATKLYASTRGGSVSPGVKESHPAGAAAKPKSGSSFMDTVNKRWERRQQEGS